MLLSACRKTDDDDDKKSFEAAAAAAGDEAAAADAMAEAKLGCCEESGDDEPMR